MRQEYGQRLFPPASTRGTAHFCATRKEKDMKRPLPPIDHNHGETVIHHCACGSTHATYQGMFPRNWTSIGQEKYCNRTACRSRAELDEMELVRVQEDKKRQSAAPKKIAKIALLKKPAPSRRSAA